ncbi:nuclear transport factor 2 family protein [Agromyces sp. NPDC058484]|uniref:nuclear transport factor 2 family protein n=1 Tax=Agromyces sp. NPDC058484 TaxID=3346524 RepID=UPI003649EB3D
MRATDPRLLILADKAEISDLVLRYCRAIDRRDFAAVRAVYTDDGFDHHTGFSGSADDFVAWVRERLMSFEGTMHLVGNHLSWVAGDAAVAETYGTAVHWGVPREEPRSNFTSGFRYIDRLRRTRAGWRIVERFAVREWTRSDAGRLLDAEASGPQEKAGEDLVARLVDRLEEPR